MMPDNQFRAQRSPSPKASPKALPPLSKFFYGPAPGRGSAEASPASYNASSWSVNGPHEQVSSLPSRRSPEPPPYSPTQWAKKFPSHPDPAQGWDDHVPPASAAPPGQFIDSYALIHKASHSPVDPTWDSNSPRASLDASRWSVNYESVPMEIQKPIPPAKPPLPPRFSQNQDQMQRLSSENTRSSQTHQSIYSSKQPQSSRVSATTIDVPLFLQPYAYDVESAPPLPRRPSNPAGWDQQSPSESPESVPRPQRLPPPPPKIPLDYESTSQLDPSLPQRPQYDPQSSLDGSDTNDRNSIIAQRQPAYDTQGTRDTEARYQEQQQNYSSHPKIPTPQFSSFNEELALPPPPSRQSKTAPQNTQASATDQEQTKTDNRFRAGSRLQQSTLFRNDNNDNERRVSNYNRQDPQASYTPSPEPQNAKLAPRDGSITTTDGSSNRAGLSTPESQQTSNTSNHESVTQSDNNRNEQPGNETFYWHSGRSDSDAEEDYGQGDSTTATPGHSSASKGSSIATMASTIRQPTMSLPPRSTSRVTTPNTIPYGASALGFGGPSDWEYFGDYEAEEVDDEDLYARTNRPAELPVDSGAPSKLFSAKEGNGDDIDDQPMFDIDPPPVPDRSPAREDAPVFSSHEDTETKHATGDYSSVRLRMSSLQSPTRLNNSWNQDDRPISYYQRPDLDEVIRAWSEAPYIGVERNQDASSHMTGEEDDVEVDRVPEASLASTPQDKFLGIDLILKDAPEMPKLPDSIDQTSPSFPSPSFGQQKFDKRISIDHHQRERNVKPSLDPKKRLSKQLDPLSKQQIEGKELNAAIRPISTEVSASRKSDKETPMFPPTTLSKQKTPNDVVEKSDEQLPARPPMVASNSGINLPKKRDRSPGSDTASRPNKVESSPLLLKESIIESSFSTPQDALKDNIHDSKEQSQHGQSQQESSPQPKLKPSERNQPGLNDAVEEASTGSSQLKPTERPLNLRKTSKENFKPSVDHTPSDNLRAEVSRQPSKDSFQDAASTLSSGRPSREDLNQALDRMRNEPHGKVRAISQTNVMIPQQKPNPSEKDDHGISSETTSKILPHTPAPIKVIAVNPNDKSLLQDSTKSANSVDRLHSSSGPTSPKSPHSPKSVRIVDPYADLDPWGKASLNRFAAMLREEARVESNRDKLNIFDVFTSRESRLRVVLYGSDDELILPSDPSEAPEPEQNDDVTSRELDETKSEEPQSDHTAAVEQTKNEQMSPIQQSGELTIEEQNAIENKLAAQIAAVEKPMAEQKLPIPETQKKKSFVQQAIERANSASTLKALPALPPNRDSVVGLPLGKSVTPVTKDIPKSKKEEAMSENIAKVSEDSPTNDTQYSPGGRPIIPKVPAKNLEHSEALVPKTADRKSAIFDDKTPEPGISTSIPEARPRPRTKTTQGESEVNNYLTNRRSVYRPFATQTLETMESGSNFGRQPDIEIDSTPIPLLRAPSSKFNTTKQGIRKTEDLPEVAPDLDTSVPAVPEGSDRRQFIQADFDPLLMVLPATEAKICDSNKLQDLTEIMEAIPEDFSFIHASVVAWDANTRIQREANDRARHERQAESEKRIDSLFDDHEIGYGDISELEAEFKRSEAARKADEDRNEYQTFVSDVFDVVWTRLHFELDQLKPQYDRYSLIMDSTFAGKDMFDQGPDALALASTMTQFLALHQKIEIRHQKAFEAVLERDRRLKKTEISPWYTLNNIPKVKQLEKQFEDAEKRAIIEYCEQRDGRANHLMDVLDQNTLRGVGANQDYMEAIMKAVRRIASGRAFDSVPGSEQEANAGLEEVKKAQTVTALLATSSEQIVQTFHVADMLLNSADYEVSVAKAKVARVDLATLAKLKEERAKEDQKLMRDLEHRLALIREDSRRTNDEIIKLMLFLGVNNERVVDGAPRALAMHMRGGSLEASAALDMQAGPVNDPEHHERMRKALDEAKRRNEKKDAR